MATKDTSIREFGRTVLTLRSDLIFTPQVVGGETCYRIEDTVNSKFYRVGVPEYTFISLLDGTTSVSRALTLAARARAGEAITEPEAAVVCKWLIESELASTVESVEPGRLADTAQGTAAHKAAQRWNPALIRLPLGHPDRFFGRIIRWISWLYSPAALVSGLMLILIATYHVAVRFDHFSALTRNILAPDNWFWLALCWLMLKLVHEFSHGAVCKRYGGTVREIGIMFIMLAPIAYVDVTSSWRFSSKWQRIHTAAAGIYLELIVGALAAIIWSYTEPGPANLLCFNAVVMASFTTLVFNANPCMKYDGYYMLSDLLEIPNLYSSGQQYLSFWVRRYLLNIDGQPPRCSGSARWLVPCYGVISFAWRIVFCAGLLLAATTLLHGAGLVLSIIAALTWWGLPAVRFLAFLCRGSATAKPDRIRFLSVLSVAAALVIIVLMLPWPGATRAPAVLEYSPLVVVRTGSSGFVRSLFVRSGDRVVPGQKIAELENLPLNNELADLELQQQLLQLKIRSLEQRSKLAASQAELESLQAIEKKYLEKASEAQMLTVYAPSDGTIIGRNLESWIGRYVKTGTAILSIGNEASVELHLSIAQDDLKAFRLHGDKPIRVRLAGWPAFTGQITRLNPSATNELSYESLASVHGGPLPVRAKSSEDKHPAPPRTDPLELLSPRFTAIATPTDGSFSSPYAGHTAVVTIRPYAESIGGRLYQVLRHWMQRKLKN